jgi:ferrous iron transport protein B
MSCSAKIPIYTIVGGALFGAKNIFVIVALYLLGCVVAIFMSLIFEKTILKSKNQSFIMEFPPYRISSLKRVGKILWKNTKEFLLKVGALIVVMNIIVWVVSSFGFSFSYVGLGKGKSMLEKVGLFFLPIFHPLGFDNAGLVCALLCGVVAKEVVVSTMAMFNGVDAGRSLSASILLSTSAIFFSTKAGALAFLVFCLLYTPCISSVAMLRSEIGFKWAIFAIVSQLLIAYVLAFFVFNLAFAIEIFGFWSVFVVLCAASLVFVSVIVLIKKLKHKKLCKNCDKCGAKCDKRK